MADIIVYTDLKQLVFPEMEAMMLHQAHEHELPVLEQTAGRLSIGAEYGSFGITALEGGLRLDVCAEEPDKLHMIREGVVDHLLGFMPDLSGSLKWSDDMKTGQYPPNFQFVEVLSSQSLNADFHRLKIRLDKPELFVSGALHFRFVLPALGDDNPQWPVLNEAGSTTWPTGDKELHRPVYTARHFNAETGVATVDVFDHEGGRAIAWAKALTVGARAAITGPGGARIPKVDKLIIVGDETAYPAIGRILDALPQAAGEVLLINHSGAAAYDLNIPKRMSLTWVRPEGVDKITALVETAVSAEPSALLWFAAEASQADAIRQSDIVKSLPKECCKIARYWTQDPSAA